MSEVQHLHREERGLQPHAVLQLQARLLLDVPGGLEDTRIRVLRMFQVCYGSIKFLFKVSFNNILLGRTLLRLRMF